MKKIYLSILLVFSFSHNLLAESVTDSTKAKKLYNQYNKGFMPLFDREKRLRDQNEEDVFDGEVVDIKIEDRDIFAIFMEGEGDVDTGVILLHSRGEQPNDNKLIKPLRIAMAESGHHSLSLQMPVLDKNAKYYDYVPIMAYSHPRITAAINFYQEIGINKIIFIAHGCGAHMLMSYLDKYGDKNINGIVGIGMGATDTGQDVVADFPLNKIAIPVLDIIGEYDYPSVKKHALIRKDMLNDKSKQIKIKQAKHYYQKENKFSELLDNINDFIASIK